MLWIIVCAILVSSLLGLRRCRGAGRRRGREGFKAACPACHNPQAAPADNVRQTREQWYETIDKMMGFGTDILRKKLPQLLDYLARTHRPDTPVQALAVGSNR